jgi:hypothetical protein
MWAEHLPKWLSAVQQRQRWWYYRRSAASWDETTALRQSGSDTLMEDPTAANAKFSHSSQMELRIMDASLCCTVADDQLLLQEDVLSAYYPCRCHQLCETIDCRSGPGRRGREPACNAGCYSTVDRVRRTQRSC